MAKKQVLAVVKIQIPAGQASPAPPVGTALGPYGLPIMDFCKEYDARTESQRGQVVPAEITVFEDRTFSFILKTPPTASVSGHQPHTSRGRHYPASSPASSVADRFVIARRRHASRRMPSTVIRYSEAVISSGWQVLAVALVLAFVLVG